MNVKSRRMALSAMGLSLTLAAMLPLAGCQFLTVNNVTFEKPTLTVGDSSRFTVNAGTMFGRTINITARADRGRVDPPSATDRREFRYYAPFTSRYRNAEGNQVNGDTIRLVIQDGTETRNQTIPVNLSGSSLVTVENPDANGQGTLKWVICSDESGSQFGSSRDLPGTGPVRGAQPTISPDGQRIAFVSYPNNGPTTAIVTIDSAGTQQVVIPGGDAFNLDPAWHPDSRTLAFVSNRGDNLFFKLYRVLAGGGGDSSPILIAGNKRNIRFPAWYPLTSGPYSNHLLASVNANDQSEFGSASGNQYPWNLFLFSPAGQVDKRVTAFTNNTDFAMEPQWRPDGQLIAFTGKGPVQGQFSPGNSIQRIRVQRIANNENSAQILNSALTGSVQESSPAWSPDGSRLMFLSLPTTVMQGTDIPPLGTPLYQIIQDAVSSPNQPMPVPLNSLIPGLRIRDLNQAYFITGGSISWR